MEQGDIEQTPEPGPADLRGMSVEAAKESIFRYLSTLKLSQKKREELGSQLDKWQKRISLARSRGAADLAAEAEKEAEKIQGQAAALDAEISDLEAQIGTMRRQLPGLAARERSIDPDLLEQELLILSGRTPGEEVPDSKQEAAFAKMDADAALEALKAKMNPGGAS
jgi:phage shock protein A